MTKDKTEEARIEKIRKTDYREYEHLVDAVDAIPLQEQRKVREYDANQLFDYIFAYMFVKPSVPLYPRFVSPRALKTLEDELYETIQNAPTEEEIRKFMESEEFRPIHQVYCERKKVYREVGIITAEIDPETRVAIKGTETEHSVRKKVDTHKIRQIPGQRFFISSGSRWSLDYRPPQIPGVVPEEANAYAAGFSTWDEIGRLRRRENMLPSLFTIDRLIGPVDIKWKNEYRITAVKFYNIKE
jgi:hypothetical protein